MRDGKTRGKGRKRKKNWERASAIVQQNLESMQEDRNLEMEYDQKSGG